MSTPHRHRASAFTLIEVMIVTTLLGVIIAGTIALLIAGLRYYNMGRDKVQASEDMRRLSIELLTTGRNSSDFRIYDNFASRNLQGSTGQGDMVAFLYADENDEAKVVRVITYYRDLGPGNTATEKDQTLRKYDTGVLPSAAFSASWLPPSSSRTQNQTIVETTADSTATQAVMFQGIPFGLNAPCAVGVSGQIVYERNHDQRRRQQNTYNLVVTCRS